MKTSFLPGLRMSLAVTAFFFASLPAAVAAEPYGRNNPKVGTRILNFFKDIAQGESPMSRYREEAPPQSNRQRSGPRYNLDAPPAAAAYDGRDARQPGMAPQMPPPRQQPYAPQDMPPPAPTRREMPYESPPAQEPAPKRTAPAPEPRRTEAPETTRTRKPPARDTSPVESTPAPEPTVAPKKPAPLRREETSPKSDPPKQEEMPPSKPADASPGAGTASTSPPPSTPPPTDTSSPLVGTKTGKPGRVKSPYPPYNELDVTGLDAGSLAMDPTTKKVFRVP